MLTTNYCGSGMFTKNGGTPVGEILESRFKQDSGLSGNTLTNLLIIFSIEASKLSKLSNSKALVRSLKLLMQSSSVRL